MRTDDRITPTSDLPETTKVEELFRGVEKSDHELVTANTTGVALKKLTSQSLPTRRTSTLKSLVPYYLSCAAALEG